MEEKMQAIQERQSNCDHLGEYESAGQQGFKDEIKKIMVLITTVMCKKCGMLFFDQQDTNIAVRATTIPIVREENDKSN